LRSALLPALLPALLLILLLAACGTSEPGKSSFTAGGLTLTPVAPSHLEGWPDDTQSEALAAFLRSCAKFESRNSTSQPVKPEGIGGKTGAWLGVCREGARLAASGAGESAIRHFFETYFRPLLVSDGNQAEGLFTGYYIPELRGSLVRGGAFRYPLYRRPPGLAPGESGPTRAQIESGALAGRGLEVVWVDDPIDAFFLHIQGSGRVILPDGRVLALGYDGGNGHRYVAIGTELIRRGFLTKETVSMQAIREWLRANPLEARAVMNRNPSYIFFRILPKGEIVGAQGVALTAGRSLAVDYNYIPYGTPIWLEADPPFEGSAPIRRLMVAQDTGGAIRGVVRGDVFWGFGAAAAIPAGYMKSRGRFYLLLPAGLPPDRS
jgi:membrane-bound lytic murein transglycosylase A